MLLEAQQASILDVVVAIRQEALALLRTTAKVMLDKEIVPLPVLRGRGITEFKEELILVKDLAGVKITLYIEKKDKNKVRIKVILADRKNRRLLGDLRISLFRDNTELESYAVRSGMVIFEGLTLGIYTLEILRKGSSIGMIKIELK